MLRNHLKKNQNFVNNQTTPPKTLSHARSDAKAGGRLHYRASLPPPRVVPGMKMEMQWALYFSGGRHPNISYFTRSCLSVLASPSPGPEPVGGAARGGEEFFNSGPGSGRQKKRVPTLRPISRYSAYFTLPCVGSFRCLGI